ncbi:DUF2878 domain-containing protein [Agaribacterium haliotis]|uniref:DUF2878 domain-containing protein n=1 Tax=Agaribacterium haliotis TaxID=2013869 RepID=UPI000BB5392D|nr:DUF2878 domain-containing protein [Agaribacterium haliotis]
MDIDQRLNSIRLPSAFFGPLVALSFNLWWFAAVYWRDQVALMLLGLWLVLCGLSPNRLRSLLLSLAFAAIGLSLELVLSLLGVYQFANQTLVPLWLIVLWLHFSFCLQHGFLFLCRLPLWQQSLAGAIAAAWSYFAAEALGAVELPFGYLSSLSLIAGAWALLLPLMLNISKYYWSHEP